MKKYIVLILVGLTFSAMRSQGISDALRLSQDNLNGTARFSAMGGAFGALGGDFSAININPAGSAVFSNNQVGFTLSNYNIKNKSNYFGAETNQNSNSFDLNQAGAVFVFKDYDPKNNWKKFTLGINYENTNNLDNSIFSAGVNPNNSATNYFAFVANSINVPVNVLGDYYYDELTLREQTAYLGYRGYLINVDQTGKYSPNVSAGNFYQENHVVTTGYNGKLNFNMATQYKDKFYFGLNLNSHFTDYRNSTNFYEVNDNNQTDGLRDFYFNKDLHTYGNGFSFQLGAIAKLNNSFRIGLSYDSPTWYTLTDELLQTVSSTGYNYENQSNTILDVANPDSNIVIVYEPYKLKTPAKYTGSMAYVFGKKGLISIDYSLKDYSTSKFRPNDSYFGPINEDMKSNLTTACELRIGAEYRIKQWSLRGGFRNEQSPYKDGKAIGALTGYSGGFGYNFGNTKLDLAYSISQRNSQQGFFSSGFTDGPLIKTKNNNFSLTLLFEL